MIIRVLKQHSAVKKNPQKANNYNVAHDGGSNFLLGTPDVFKLRYIKAKTQKDIKGLNKFKTCALKSVSVDYTGEAARFAAYNEDSQPVTTLVTLNFSELVPIYDEDYHEFTNDDDVENTLDILGNVVHRLRELSPLWEMHLDGIDLDTVKWNAH